MWEKPFDLTKGVVSFHRKQNISWIRPLPAYNIPSGVAIDTECSFLCARILCHSSRTIYRMERSVFVTIVCKRDCLLIRKSDCMFWCTSGFARYFGFKRSQYFYYSTLFSWVFIHEHLNIVMCFFCHVFLFFINEHCWIFVPL